jgi:hypothetical protein
MLRLTARSIAAPALTAATTLFLLAPGCGSDAVGVEDCRKIEQARCDAGAACGRVKDVEACRRFYRDHCLHGLPLESSPGTIPVKACTDAIQAAAACARQGGPGVSSIDCPGVGTTRLPLACDVVGQPEATEPCRFLVPSTPPITIDAPTDNAAADSGGD